MSLTLRLGDDDVTAIASDIRIKSTSPGGFSSVSFNVKRKLEQSLLDSFTDCLVYDSQTAEQVGGGRLLEQGRNDDGTWQVTALGEGLASMQDRTEPYMLIDSTDDNWEVRNRNTKRVSFSTGQAPTSSEFPGLFFNTTEATIANGSFAIMAHRGPSICNMNLGGMGFAYNSGQTDADWSIEPRAYAADLSGSNLLNTYSWAGTATSTRKKFSVGADWAGNRPVAGYRVLRVNTDDTGVASTWTIIRNSVVRTQLFDRFGVLRTGTDYRNEYVLMSEAFTDLLARFCPRLDIANAFVETTAHQFDQLIWMAGISPMGAMEEMMDVEQAYTWHVWDQQANGLWRTELVPKPTAVRYEASVDEGFAAPAPASELYNRVVVTWTSQQGRPQSTEVSSTVASLDAAGITRSATITLGSERGSSANAAKAGADFLAEHSEIPNSGTLTITAGTRIRDNFTGRMVPPWRIRPNELVRVRGVQPLPSTLNADSPDGATVFRIVSNEYSETNASSVLELDDFVLTESRAIAKLLRKRTVA